MLECFPLIKFERNKKKTFQIVTCAKKGNKVKSLVLKISILNHLKIVIIVQY